MTVKPFFPSQTWALDQLIQLGQRQLELVNTALNRLLSEDADLRWAMVINAYLDQQINLGKAAEFLEIHELELRERFIRLGIPLRIGSTDVAEARAEVDALRTWLGETQPQVSA